MSVFDDSKDVIGKHIGSATDEALRTIITKFAGAVKTVSNPSPSAVSGKLARAYSSGVMDADNKVPMRIPAFCYDKRIESIAGVENVIEIENDDLIAEYQRGYNDTKRRKSFNKALMIVGFGVGGLTFFALVCEYKRKKNKKRKDEENG